MAVPKKRTLRAKKIAKIRRKQLEIAMKKIEFANKAEIKHDRMLVTKIALRRVYGSVRNSHRRANMDHVGYCPRIGSGIPDVPVEVPMPVSNGNKKGVD